MTAGSKEGSERTSNLAVTALILSLVGMFFALTAIPGLIIGLIEFRRVKEGRSSEASRGTAFGAIIIGALIIGVWTVIITVFAIKGNLSFDAA